MKKFLSSMLVLLLACALFAEDFKYIPECSAKVDSHEWIEHTAYSLCYNEDSEQPEFTVFEMTKSEAERLNSVPRKNSFRADPTVSTGSATLADYKKSGYSRGHMVANGDMNYSTETASETFFLSNMSPQLQTMNGGAWLAVENYTQEFLMADGSEYDSVYIYNIPLVNKDFPRIGSIGANEVAVPVGYFKVMYIPEVDEFLCWYVEQNCKDTSSSSSNAKNYLVSLERVEQESGLYFSFSKKSSKVANSAIAESSESQLDMINYLEDYDVVALVHTETDEAEGVSINLLLDFFSLEEIYNALVYHIILVMGDENYQLITLEEQNNRVLQAKLDSQITEAETQCIVDVLYNNGTISTNDADRAVYSISYVYVFNAGKAAKHIEHDFNQDWDGSDLDRACASILRRLKIIDSDTYYKGAYYEVFLAGYNF